MTEILTLHRRFRDYSFAFKGNTPRTVRWFHDSMRSFVTHSGIEKLDEATRGQIEEWLFRGKNERSWSAKTIRNHLQALSSFFEWCVKEEFLPENPVKKISRPKLPKRIPKHLTKEQALNLIEWAWNFNYSYKFERSRAAAIIATFIFSGVRLQELVNLKLQEIDLENKTLFVKSGKGEKDRIVPLCPRLIEILKAYLKDRNRLKKNCPYFFTAMREDNRMGDKVIPRLVQRLREKSGIYFYPHMLRHTFATLMLEGGCDLFSLSKMMGHSDIKTTTIYLSATAGHLQEQIAKHPLNDA
ncbi:tyrosine-type recombinase/integrase [Desulfobacter vibrioformis]|uniref:tyrosine-type recombinase/integrase n=1 Tax=Desulfobacter vibrioformis TaxID=34031 RepID=UPI000A02773A|nr:tyrosine-type recombinase/integrase [Desulfobacter vibrioformis]